MHLNEVRQCRDGRIVHRSLSFSFGNLDAIQQFRRKPLVHEFNLSGASFNEFLLDEGGDLLQFLVHLLETLNLPHQNRLQSISEADFLLFLASFGDLEVVSPDRHAAFCFRKVIGYHTNYTMPWP